METTTYHKINGPFKRDMDKKGHPLVINEWAVEEFELLQNIKWIAYEKIDGTNIRVIYDGNSVEFKGRTDNADIPQTLVPILKNKFTVDILSSTFSDVTSVNPVVLYGEGYGYKIQSGCKYFSGKRDNNFILFDVKIGQWWLQDKDVTLIAFNIGANRVPFVATGTLDSLFALVKKGLRSNFGDFYAEGVVAKPVIQLFSRSGSRIITKIKHRDFFDIID